MEAIARARWTERLLPFSIGLGLGFGAILASICALWAVTNWEDVLRAYPSPELHEDVRELAKWPFASQPRGPRVRHDFNGDGVADDLSVEYFHMEPLLRRATSGMVSVQSGRTRRLLLAHAVANPCISVEWIGDVDGNGTDDLLVSDFGRTLVLGHVRSR